MQAERSPNQADQSDPEKKRHHCGREQEASPLFFIHVYICEKWPRKGSRGTVVAREGGIPTEVAFASPLTQLLLFESPVLRIALL